MAENSSPTRVSAGSPDRCADELTNLASGARLGDRRAVRTLLVAVGPAMLRAIRQVMGPQYPDVEDHLQEASINFVDALPRFAGGCTILHFACRVAVLTAMNARRREATAKRGWRRLPQVELHTLPAPEARPESCLDERYAMVAVRQLMTSLPQAQAEALTLHCVLGCTIDEIASALAVPAETIRSRLRLSKQALRKYVTEDTKLAEIVDGVS